MAEQTDAPSPSLILAPQRGSSRPTARGSIGGIKNISGWRSSRQQASAAQTTQSDGSKVEETASDKEKKSDEVELANDAKDTSSTSMKSPMRPPEGESPLENSWCFWFDRRAKVKGRNASYESNLKRIGGFCTVEGMWGFLNHMTKPTQVEHGANYHLFKENIKPMWEDKANANGGKWVVHIKGGRHHLDTYWLNLVLGLAGETIDEGDEICGAVMSRRRQGDRIAIWNRNKGSSEVIMKLGKRIKETISYSVTPIPSFTMEYAYHDDSIKSGHSYANPKRYTL
mmetsp:Transcript_675/g.916  ORF Transcript_675/g.916 Transcript_675/m.916 type:complete len:284 (+) Transcript_675:7-858(+)|eukprot:jgi/Bigna1/52698/estExt_Genewise1Plus.C_100135